MNGIKKGTHQLTAGINRMEKAYWKTKEGKVMLMSEMTDQHLLNSIAYVKRRAKEGIESILNMGYAPDNDYVEYDVTVIYGKEATDFMGLPDLLKEKRRRKLTT